VTQSTPIIAFDQHAATTVAAVLLPGERTPALHTLTSETGTVVKFVERLCADQPIACCYEAGPCGVLPCRSRELGRMAGLVAG
jgi:hypothetical protein